MARRFKGSTSDWLSLSSALVSTAPYTISAWGVSFDNTNAQVIFECSNTGTVSEKIRCWYRADSGQFEYLVWSTAASFQQLVGGTPLPGVPFHYCAVARTNSDRELYINGISVGTNSAACSPAPNNTTIGLQVENGGAVANPFNGHLGPIAIWPTTALTYAQVRRMAAGHDPYAVRPTFDLVYWRFDKSTNHDVTGRNLLTVNGAVTPARDLLQFSRARVRDYDAQAASAPSVGAPFYYMRHVAQVGDPSV